jgi:aminoglycoside 2'-N-acetyltransferase I
VTALGEDGRVNVRIAHTADVEPGTLAAARALLDEVFAGELDDHDWEHALGGLHALAYEADELIGHASLVQRRLLHGGTAHRVGYVEGVGVQAAHRRRGVGAAVMAPLERAIRNAYAFGALGTTDEAVPFYTRRGWQRWRGTAHALTPDGPRRTTDEEGAIYVLPNPATPLDLDAPLTCDWRDGDVW